MKHVVIRFAVFLAHIVAMVNAVRILLSAIQSMLVLTVVRSTNNVDRSVVLMVKHAVLLAHAVHRTIMSVPVGIALHLSSQHVAQRKIEHVHRMRPFVFYRIWPIIEVYRLYSSLMK